MGVSESFQEKWRREGLNKRLDDLNYHLNSLNYTIKNLIKELKKQRENHE